MAFSSLTGGGGLSNSSSAGSGTGDQSGGGFTVGSFFAAGQPMDKKTMLMIGAAFLVGAGGVYALSKKKR